MAINLICRSCKSNANVRSRECKKCGESLSGCMYRVIVKSHDGKRVTKSVDNITTARKLEATFMAEAQQRKLFGNQDNPLIDKAGEQFLAWAQIHKKSWRDDEERWRNHVLPHLRGRRMDAVTPYEVQRLPEVMMGKRVYAPATIKQVLVLVEGVQLGKADGALCRGESCCRDQDACHQQRAHRVSVPEEIRKLLSFLDQWKNRAAPSPSSSRSSQGFGGWRCSGSGGTTCPWNVDAYASWTPRGARTACCLLIRERWMPCVNR